MFEALVSPPWYNYTGWLGMKHQQTSAALHLSPLSRKIWKRIFLKNASLLVCETPFLQSLTIGCTCVCRGGGVNMITDVLCSVNMYILFLCKALWAKSCYGHCAIEVLCIIIIIIIIIILLPVNNHSSEFLYLPPPPTPHPHTPSPFTSHLVQCLCCAYLCAEFQVGLTGQQKSYNLVVSFLHSPVQRRLVLLLLYRKKKCPWPLQRVGTAPWTMA